MKTKSTIFIGVVTALGAFYLLSKPIKVVPPIKRAPGPVKTAPATESAKPSRTWPPRTWTLSLNPPESSELHPLVKYENPGSIRSFYDDKLLAAYDVYFSLIGPAKDKYPFAHSPFDTEANSRLAYETLRATRYERGKAVPEEVHRAGFLAVTHLAHSELPASEARRRQLIDEWTKEIAQSDSARLKSLRELDVRTLLVALPRGSDEAILNVYRDHRDPVIQSGVALALAERKMQEGYDSDETQEFFARNGINFPKISNRILKAGEKL